MRPSNLEPKMQELYSQINRLGDEIKSPADERIQDALEVIYELLGILVSERKS